MNYTKYLGIIIDEFITFKEHINHLVNKLKQYCGIFYKFRSRLPKKCLRTIYFAMIHSHLNYGVAIYGNTTTSQLEPLLKINNKILRILQSKPLKTPVEQLYNNYNTLQITELRDYNIICLVHKFIHNLQDLPEIYHSYFTFNSEIHSYNTRTSSNLHIQQFNSNLGYRHITILESNLWNKLPKTIKIIKSPFIFKTKLKFILK